MIEALLSLSQARESGPSWNAASHSELRKELCGNASGNYQVRIYIENLYLKLPIHLEKKLSLSR